MTVTNVLIPLVALVSAYAYLTRKPSSGLPKPPGPKPLPLVGNILNLTTHQLWLRVTDWSMTYGKVIYVHVFGQGLVFLSTAEACIDLLDKRGSIYSDKPHLVMCGELCGCENMAAFTSYGDQMRRQRKLMQRALGPTAIPKYHSLLEMETPWFLKRLLENPEDYITPIRRYAGGMTLLVVYGYQVKSDDDTFLQLADHCIDLLANEIASGGGIWPVDIFPALRRLPEWMPGAGFLKKARAWRAKIEELVDKPYEFVQESLRKGIALPSFCSTLLEENEAQDAQGDFDLRWTANSMYTGSIDTTMTLVLQFFLAMIEHPEAMKKAQKEIDSVVGNDRLPTFADRENLPYLEALFNECLRYGVGVPLSLPHRLMEDDIYEGMFIPKGSLVFANVWNILRDETMFKDAHLFKPERYLEPVDEETAKRRDPKNYSFGFGRRICPGRYLVQSSAWILMASLLATMDISKAVDANGKQIEPEVKYENSIFRMPSKLQMNIKPRSERAVGIIDELTNGQQ
ncbi:cytochrome P450 [Thelephora ganbajun]|uniref:Cytochrome P450 n=1 Tax=Thelephora ganbajun TaxID=370292 RepID=A0ACB6ZSU8_THEGA|nr:cytochrome P450 [Thelephora ganbajun]